MLDNAPEWQMAERKMEKLGLFCHLPCFDFTSGRAFSAAC
jgi:hypothetical protein